MKVLSKEQFREMISVKLEPYIDNFKTKYNIKEPRMRLLPNNIGLINGNKYKITIDEFKDIVEMIKIEEF